jgi:hypothetical protein
MLLLPSPAPAESTRSKLARELTRPRLSGELADVLGRIGKAAELEIRVDWQQLAETGVKPDDRISSNPDKASVSQSLELVLTRAGKRGKPLGWFTGDGVVYVTTLRRAMRKVRFRAIPLPETKKDEPSREDAEETDDGHDRDDASGARSGRRSEDRGGKVEFVKLSLENAITYFREASETNIVVNWKALEQSGLTRDTEITLEVRNVTFATGLSLVLEQANGRLGKFSRAYWVIDSGIVKISTGSALNMKTRTRVWDVADLVHTARDFEAPEGFNVSVSSDDNDDDDGNDDFDDIFGDDDDDDDDDDDATASREENIQTLIRIIKRSIGEDMWRENGGKGSVHVLNNKLVITQTLLGWKLLEQVGISG